MLLAVQDTGETSSMPDASGVTSARERRLPRSAREGVDESVAELVHPPDRGIR